MAGSNGYDISVLILTYNPDTDKLLQTIYSCFIQEGIQIQIVIADDGSKNFESEKIKAFFEKYDFTDYEICRLDENAGTVKNCIHGLQKCKGDYIKLFSPGDFLYKKDVLKKWLDFVLEQGATASISDAVYFNRQGDGISPVAVKAYLQTTEYKNQDDLRRHYLLYEECGLGAATLVERKTLAKYLGMIEGKVKYAEDHIYRLMNFEREKIVYFNRNTILYEYGTGISTSVNDVWHERLMKDLQAANQIMLAKMDKKDAFNRNLKRMFKFQQMDSFHGKGILQALLIKGRFKQYIRTKRHPRMTDTDIDVNYVDEVLNCIKKKGAEDYAGN